MATFRDVPVALPGQYGCLSDHGFFDKAREALKNEVVYENFLRCLQFYNRDVVSGSELVEIVTPFLRRFPKLLQWFKDLLNNDSVVPPNSGHHKSSRIRREGSEPILNCVVHKNLPTGITQDEINYTAGTRIGAHYVFSPEGFTQQKCTGRTALCNEVLNDTLMTFPRHNKDSTFAIPQKSRYEEFIYRCEEERFELDIAIQINLSSLHVLESVHEKLSHMSPEKQATFRLDDCLGGSSPTIHQQALRRIYGDKAADIISNLKTNPAAVLPGVLCKLIDKDEEWRRAQKIYNEIWRKKTMRYEKLFNNPRPSGKKYKTKGPESH